jgi:hypothetical protein
MVLMFLNRVSATPMPLFVATAAFGWSRKLGRKIKQADAAMGASKRLL